MHIIKLYSKFFILTLLYISCNLRDQKFVIKTNNTAIGLSPIVDSLFQQFQLSNKKAKSFAIFFDKKDSKTYRITLTASSDSNSFKTLPALNYYFINDSVPVYLYSGIENFLLFDTTSNSQNLNDISDDILPGFAAMSLVKTRDTTYVIKNCGVPPFISQTLLPTVYFKPPK
jgi:hypothetical protein